MRQDPNQGSCSHALRIVQVRASTDVLLHRPATSRNTPPRPPLLQVPATDLDEGISRGTKAHGSPGTSRGCARTGAQDAPSLGSSAVINLASSDDNDDRAGGADGGGRGADHTHTHTAVKVKLGAVWSQRSSGGVSSHHHSTL